jgi:hypothetical protein
MFISGIRVIGLRDKKDFVYGTAAASTVMVPLTRIVYRNPAFRICGQRTQKLFFPSRIPLRLFAFPVRFRKYAEVVNPKINNPTPLRMKTE